MDRILLYYPSINIPDRDWLRNSILYTDKVASIFPYEEINDARLSDDMRLLYDENQYIPFSTFDLVDRLQGKFSRFDDDIIATFESDEFRQLIQPIGPIDIHETAYRDYKMCLNKLSPKILDYLSHNNLLKEISWEEAIVEKHVAAYYMTRLAELFALHDENLVTPSTDDHDFEKLVFNSDVNAQISHQLRLEKCLPTPSRLTDLKNILKFKSKRREELLRFRIVLDDFQEKIANSETVREKNYHMIQLKEKIEIEISIIKRLLGESKFDIVLNGFSSLFDFYRRDSIGTALATVIAPISFGISSIILAVTLASSYTRSVRQARTNPFSYVFYAQKQAILN